MTSKTTTDSSEGPRLWGGRFSSKTDELLDQFGSSIGYDKRMWAADIKGSKAYVKSLQKVGIVSQDDMEKILQGLEQVYKEWENESFIIIPSDEDIHTANERRLVELIGSAGGKLHTGRSRNDQVATDMRLWLGDAIKVMQIAMVDILKVLITRAEKDIDVLMPGYTHMQRAQPIRWSHWLLSYAWSLKSDWEKLDGIRQRTLVLPLGSGALSGHPFGIDREFLRNELGFYDVTENSLYGVSDRDFVADFLYWASLTSIHLSRLAEDLILYCTKEFGFVTLSDAYSTGSSLMPQKKNADSLELIRGKAGRIFGRCNGFLMVLKGLPSTYNKDLQEDKEAMFEVYDTLLAIIQIAAGTIDTLTLHPDVCKAALSNDMLATDVAYYLVRKGVAFRDAHCLAGSVVALAEKNNVELSQLNISDYKSISDKFEADIVTIWNYEASVEQYKSIGGTCKANCQQQINHLKAKLGV
ncbi:hypothetical protein CHUAL_012659 [Chamberlinius hualienensis]